MVIHRIRENVVGLRGELSLARIDKTYFGFERSVFLPRSVCG
jgi:hypothetical protein